MAYYSIQNIPLTDLAKDFGTPLYVYDADKIREKISVLRAAFEGIDLTIKYAVKANTNLSILRLMRENGADMDVVSPQELELGLIAGYEGSNITFTPSGVHFSEIEYAVSKGAIVNLDNLSVLEKFGATYGSSQPCLIRIKPHVFGGGNEKIMTAHPESKFGISIHQKSDILAIVEKYKINVIGLHQHTGSDIKDGKTFEQAASALFDFAYDFKDLQIIDLGGGFKVPYQPGEKGTDMPLLGAEVNKAMQHLSEKFGRSLSAWFEPGKYMVSEAGFFIAKVNVLKPSGDRIFAGLNTGLNHLIRPMFYDAYHHIDNLSHPSNPTKQYAVVGNICETDTFAWDREIPTIEEGDLLVFYNAGAYGYEMASNYNARFKPAQVLFEKGISKLISRRDQFEDLLSLQIPLNK